MNDYLKEIAFLEGYRAYMDKVSAMDNPYMDVSDTLAEYWSHGFWEAFDNE